MDLTKEGVLFIEEEPVYIVREVRNQLDKEYLIAFPISEKSKKKYQYSHDYNDLEIPIQLTSKTYIDFDSNTNDLTRILTNKGFNKENKRVVKQVAAPLFVSNIYLSQTDVVSGNLMECFKVPTKGKPTFVGTNNIKWKKTYLTLDGFSDFLYNIVSDPTLEVL